MIYSWADVARKYVVRHEGTGKRVTLGGIKELVSKDEDYLIEIQTRIGSIYRHDLEGKVWAAYIKPSPAFNKQYSIWRQLEDIGAEQVQVGDSEAVYKFSAGLLDKVAFIMKAHKRFKRKKRNK